MLFVLSMCGYPIDGLTQSTVLAINEVVKANKYVLAGYSAVGLTVVLLVWMCAAYRRLMSDADRERDHFSGPGSQSGDLADDQRLMAIINSGGL